MYVHERVFIPVPLLASGCGLLAGMVLVGVAADFSPLLTLTACVGLLVTLAVFAFPTFGLLLTTFVIPMERLGRFTDDSSAYTISLMRIVGVLALGSFLLHACIKKWKLNFGTALCLYLAYWCFGLLTVCFSSDVEGGIRYAGSIFGNLVFFFLVINVVRSWQLAKIAVMVWLLASVLAGVYTMYEWHSGKDVVETQIGETAERFTATWQDTSEWQDLGEARRRAMGPTSHAAVYGINMLMTLPFLAYLFRVQPHWRMRAAVLLGSAIIGYNLFLTNTRAVILFIPLVLLLCVLRKLLVITPSRAIGVLLLGVALLWVVPESVYQRALNVSNYSLEQSGTLRIRFDFWRAALRVVETHWLIGTGIGNFRTIPQYLNQDVLAGATSTHNEYIQTLLEVGVPGWVLFLSFVGLLLRRSFHTATLFWRRQQEEQYWFMVACQITMITVLLFGLQVDVFHFPLKGWWLVASLSWVMSHLAQHMPPSHVPAIVPGGQQRGVIVA
jgi:putative inorganic carbon (hco3(-)) transporter